MGINTICVCDRCQDTKPAYESSNYPMPVAWAKLDLSIRGAHKNDVKVGVYYLCEKCITVLLNNISGNSRVSQ